MAEFPFNLDVAAPNDKHFLVDTAPEMELEASVAALPVNLDGAVSFLDIAPFISLLSSGDLQAEADIDESGAVDFLDIAPFIALLSGG